MMSLRSRRVAWILACALSSAVAGCADSAGPDTVPALLSIVGLDTLRSLGATAAIEATVRNKDRMVIAGLKATGWTSSDTAVVTVNASTGVVTALANGTATVTAHYDTLSDSLHVVVWQRAKTVLVSGPGNAGSLGSTMQLTAAAADSLAHPITGRHIQWSSSNAAVVSVDSAGVATARGAGTATVSATMDPASGTHDIIVAQVPASLKITATTDTLRALGATTQYSAVARDSGGSVIAGAVVRWNSSAASVASVDSVQGVASAVSNGSALVRARAGGAADSVALVVRQRADPTKSVVSLPRAMLFASDTILAKLQTRDALDHPLTFGGANVGFATSGGTSAGAFGPTVDVGDGTYVGAYVGQTVGTAATVSATLDGANVTTPAPTLRVVGFTKVAAYNSSFAESCGIITTGDMYCWGEPNYGFRGTGTLVPATDSSPTKVSGGYKWADLDIGGSMAVCGITDAAKLLCWGQASQGALGNGATGGNYATPVPILADSSFSSIDLGLPVGGCAVTSGSTALCWSNGTWGRLGNGADTNVAVPVRVSGTTQFSRVATSSSSSCGVSGQGTAVCWGIYSQLGVGSGPYPDQCAGPVDCAKTPVATSGAISFTPVLAMDGGQVCAVGTDTKTYCWGMWNNVPTAVGGAPAFTALSAGDRDACGLAPGGAVYCWGTNRNARFGSPADANQTITTPVQIASGHTFTQIAMAQTYMCGIAPDGNAWCWGSNDQGQLGDGTTTASSTPVRVRLFR